MYWTICCTYSLTECFKKDPIIKIIPVCENSAETQVEPGTEMLMSIVVKATEGSGGVTDADHEVRSEYTTSAGGRSAGWRPQKVHLYLLGNKNNLLMFHKEDWQFP